MVCFINRYLAMFYYQFAVGPSMDLAMVEPSNPRQLRFNCSFIRLLNKLRLCRKVEVRLSLFANSLALSKLPLNRSVLCSLLLCTETT